MAKKPATEYREISATLARAEPSPVAAWKPYKVIKHDAYINSDIPAKYEAEKAQMKAKYEAKKQEAIKDGTELPEEPHDPIDQFESQFGIEKARVRRHLDKLGLNASITAYIKTIKDKYGDIPNPVYTQDEKEQREAVLEERVRIGNLVANYLRGFCEEIVNDLTHIAIESALHADRKIVRDSHIFDANGFYIGHAQFKNLFMGLPSFVEARMKYMLRDSHLLASEAVRDYFGEISRNINVTGREKYDVMHDNVVQFIKTLKKPDEEEEDEPEAAAAASSSAATDASATISAEMHTCEDARFTFYIKKMLKTIRNSDQRYSGLRFSRRLTPFIDSVLNEFIQLVAMRAFIHIETTEAQTVSTAVVRSVVLGMMASPASLLDRRVSVHGTGDAMETQMTDPAFIKMLDELYPLGPKVAHARPRAQKKPVAATGVAPAVAPAAPVVAKTVTPVATTSVAIPGPKATEPARRRKVSPQ